MSNRICLLRLKLQFGQRLCPLFVDPHAAKTTAYGNEEVSKSDVLLWSSRICFVSLIDLSWIPRKTVRDQKAIRARQERRAVQQAVLASAKNLFLPLWNPVQYLSQQQVMRCPETAWFCTICNTPSSCPAQSSYTTVSLRFLSCASSSWVHRIYGLFWLLVALETGELIARCIAWLSSSSRKSVKGVWVRASRLGRLSAFR
ncbi:hypothetical protein DL98DRAFT_525002 [Cadophora sp. DSE1049]|nr:hypothetical protein DL98DRAFT_525002 [Cadophora sp. DSE1049]